MITLKMSTVKKLIILFTFFLFVQNNTFSQLMFQKNISKQKVITFQGKQVHFELKENVVSKKKRYSEHKDYFWYRSQSIIITKGAASGYLLNGYYESYFDNHQFSERGCFKNGLKHGKWVYWNQEGQIIKKEKWFFGKLLTPISQANNDTNE